jgi:hypothetical protein
MRFALFLVFLIYSGAFCLVYTPRIKINDQVDCYNLETILQGILKPGMTQAQKAEAAWRFMLSKTFHYKAPDEGLPGYPGTTESYLLSDALKIINVYGYAYCFEFDGILASLWEAAGFDSTRIWGLPGHLISEVYYDGAWHYYDSDQSVSAYFLKKDGKTVASVEDIRSDPDYYIVNNPFRSSPSMPFNDHPIYEHESREKLATFFKRRADHNIRDRKSLNLHRMDYYLRKNETLTLFFDPQGKWRHVGMDVSFVNAANGPYDVHGSAKYGNGLFAYRPDLSDTSFLEEGLQSASNLALDHGALVLADTAKAGEAVIKVLSPYIIAGMPRGPSVTKDSNQSYSGAAILSGRIKSLKDTIIDPVDLEVQISTDKMLGRFQTVYKQIAGGFFNIDLSEWLSLPTYYYSLKIILKKSRTAGAREPRLDSLDLRTWVQVNPAALPKLVPGENKIIYSAQGPAVDKVDFIRYLSAERAMDYIVAMKNVVLTKDPRKRFVPIDTTHPGEILFEMAAPEGTIADYFLAMVTYLRENMRSAVFISENDTSHWKDAGKRPKLYQDHWRDPFALWIKAGPDVRKVYFKVVLEGNAALVTFDFGYRYAYKPSSGNVSVVQAAEVDGKLKEFAWDFKGKEGNITLKIPGKKVANKYLRYICK